MKLYRVFKPNGSIEVVQGGERLNDKTYRPTDTPYHSYFEDPEKARALVLKDLNEKILKTKEALHGLLYQYNTTKNRRF